MRGLIAPTLLGLGLLTAPAAAQDGFRPADSYPQLGAVLEPARAAWPDSPCRGHEEVLIDDNVPAHMADTLGGAVILDGRCLVLLRPKLFEPGWEYGLCVVLTHEFGHLAGHEHSTDPADIMFPTVDTIQYRPCWLATKPPDAPPPAPSPVVVPFMTLNEASGKTVVLLKRRSHGEARRARCHDGDNATIICRASWRYKRSRYRAIVTLREGGEQIRVSRVPRM